MVTKRMRMQLFWNWAASTSQMGNGTNLSMFKRVFQWAYKLFKKTYKMFESLEDAKKHLVMLEAYKLFK